MKHMKRLLAALLALVLVFSVAGAALANNYSGFCGKNTTWKLNGTGVLTIEGTGSMSPYAPASKSDFRQHDTKIKTVVIKTGVTGIGAYAFHALPALTTVKMNDGGSMIHQYAFSDCPALSSVDLGSTIVEIGSYAFSNCPSLADIVLSESISSVQNHAFAGCTGLKTVKVLNQSCTFTSSDVFPKTATIIGYKNSTAQTYAEKNGLTFKTLDGTTINPPATPTQPTPESGKCPLCGQPHEGFPGSLIGGIHSFIFTLLMLFGLRSAA